MTATNEEPSLLQVVTTLGGPELVHQLQELFGLDEDLDPTAGETFLSHIGRASLPLTKYVRPMDSPLPEAVLDLAFDARTIHTAKWFVETTDSQFRILSLLKPDENSAPCGSGTASFQYSQVERSLIWDDPSSDSDLATLAVLHGLLYLALLSGDPRVLEQRLSIACALIGGETGNLARLYTDEIVQHELFAHHLIQLHLKDPVGQRDLLRNLLRDITDDQLASVSKWHDPALTYQEYRKKLAAERTFSGGVPHDPRYRGGFTLEDLRNNTYDLYGSSSVYLDEERLDVLDDLIDHFGKDRCTLLRGEFNTQYSLDLDTAVIDKSYVILAVRARDEGPWQEDAIAISPFAGAHGVYYVRSDVSQKSWQDVLAAGKFSARMTGARSLRFRSGEHFDEYEAMTWKLQALSQCNTADFATGRVTYDSWAMEYRVT